MEDRQMKLYNDKVYGHKVSDYALESGYLDYLTLSKIVGDCVLNNNLFEAYPWDWEIVNGGEIFYDEDDSYTEIYQYYIISDYGYEFLRDNTNEIVFYNDKVDLYLWGITHFGTSWDYVLTDIKLIK